MELLGGEGCVTERVTPSIFLPPPVPPVLLLLHILLAGGNNTDVDMVDSGQMEEFSQSIPGVNLTYLGRVRHEAEDRRQEAGSRRQEHYVFLLARPSSPGRAPFWPPEVGGA